MIRPGFSGVFDLSHHSTLRATLNRAGQLHVAAKRPTFEVFDAKNSHVGQFDEALVDFDRVSDTGVLFLLA